MCTVLLPPGDNPTAVNKYIIYHGEGINLNEVSVGEIFSRETEGKHFWMKVLPCI